MTKFRMIRTDCASNRFAALHTRDLEVTYEVGGNPIRALHRHSLTIDQDAFVDLLGADVMVAT